jgi:hypothetical protein
VAVWLLGIAAVVAQALRPSPQIRDVSLERGSSMPTVRRQVLPELAVDRSQKLPDTIDVEIVVNRSGRVVHARIVDRQPARRAWEEATLAAVAKWSSGRPLGGTIRLAREPQLSQSVVAAIFTDGCDAANTAQRIEGRCRDGAVDDQKSAVHVDVPQPGVAERLDDGIQALRGVGFNSNGHIQLRGRLLFSVSWSRHRRSQYFRFLEPASDPSRRRALAH